MYDAIWYVRFMVIKRDLRILKIGTVLNEVSVNYVKRIVIHPNGLARRLKRKKIKRRLKIHPPRDLFCKY